MTAEFVQRDRRAAILAADVVGYTRLMNEDGVATHEALKDRRRRLLQPLIDRHHGRLFKVTGDGALVEFTRAVDAVQCAQELQLQMAAENTHLPESRHIVLRIGIGVGNVLVEGGDLYGTPVILAARLEKEAEPGGILVSHDTYLEVGEENAADFQACELSLKNIAEPVVAYSVTGLPPAAAAKLASRAPSVVILPFRNVSNDPRQQYFSDGLTEDIITALSCYHSLRVIAPYSSFQLRDLVATNAVRSDLLVEFVVQGSVQRRRTRIRVDVRLTRNEVLWTQRYDRRLKEVSALFALQDDLVNDIVDKLENEIAVSDARRAAQKPPENWDAYECVLRGREHWNRYQPREAEVLFKQAARKDPKYAQAYSWQSISRIVGGYFEDGDREKLDDAHRLAQKALELDPKDACSHRSMGVALMIKGEMNKAGHSFDRALELNPTDSFTICLRGLWSAHMGRAQQALIRVDEVLNRDPIGPPFYWEFRGAALFQAEEYEQAIEAFHKMTDDAFGRLTELPWWCHCYLAASYAHLGKMKEAWYHAEQVRKAKLNFKVADIQITEPFIQKSVRDRFMLGLRLAGLRD